jgi:hypothetical protein
MQINIIYILVDLVVVAKMMTNILNIATNANPEVYPEAGF